MDLKVFLSTFGLIFLAELGDKTQLAAISMVSSTKKPFAVFLGASVAMIVVTALGVIFGGVLMKFVPERIMHIISGAFFILIGLLILVGKF